MLTYIEMLLYPLSSYVHYILMCHPLLMSAGLVCGIVDVGAYTLKLSSAHHNAPQDIVDAATTRLFWRLYSILMPLLLAVWDSFFFFYFLV